MSNISNNLRSIFVFMCGINEDDIALTVESAFANARFPERIYFGVIDQRTDGNFSDVSNFQNVKKVDVSYPYPLGLGLGRLNALMLHENQDFCLQIDAHTIFDKHWDSLLLRDYRAISPNNEVIVISTRPKWYDYDKNGKRQLHDTVGSALIIEGTEYYEMTGKHGKINYFPDGGFYSEHFLTVGGFVFSELSFFCDVMPDPRIAFYGEEHVLAMRASTRGYRIFAIGDCHMYSLGKHEEQNKYDVTSLANINEWKKLKGRGAVTPNKPGVDFDININDKEGVVKQILNGEIFGYWGAPNSEAYDAYIANLGFSYRDEALINLEPHAHH